MTIPGNESLIYSFGEYELDTRLHELRRGSDPLRVEPQVFSVLAHLFASRDRVVPKGELLDVVWGHRYVAPTTLNSRIKAARQVVGDTGRAQRVIRTIHGRGFRVVADVTERPAAGGSAAQSGRQSIHFCTMGDGVRLAYAMSGDGPPLVKPANWLTHLEQDWDSPVWRHWLRELSRDHTLIRYDERGSGLSDREVADVSFDTRVQDLEALLDAIGVERFSMFACSQACAVAITYAARHPDRVTRLVLYGGYAQGSTARARTPQERREAEMLQKIPLGIAHDNPAFRMFYSARCLPEGSPEQMRWFSEVQRLTTSPDAAVRLRSSFATVDVRASARRVRAPTLVMHATDDGAVPFEQGRVLAALIPGARFVALDSRNHILLEDEPAWRRLVEEVRGFLTEPDRSAAARPAGRKRRGA